MDKNKGVKLGCGCFSVCILFIILLALFFSCDSGSSNSNQETDQTDQTQQTEDNQTTANVKNADIPVNQTLEFGDGYTITLTHIVIGGNSLTAYLDIYNNNLIPLTIDQIMGFYAYQGDNTLNDANFKAMNSALLDTTIEPGQTLKDIDLLVEIKSDTEPIELTFFPDDTTGYNEDGATEMDVTINPVDDTVNTEFNTY